MLICELPSWPAAFLGPCHRWIFLLSVLFGPFWRNVLCLSTHRGKGTGMMMFEMGGDIISIFSFLVDINAEIKKEKVDKMDLFFRIKYFPSMC